VESHLIPMFLVGTTKANTEVEGLRWHQGLSFSIGEVNYCSFQLYFKKFHAYFLLPSSLL
jgi:hypothetical protein